MARDVPTALLVRMRASSTSLARIMSIVRKDGRTVRLTDATFDLSFGGFTYYSFPGFTCSAVYSSAIGGKAQGLELGLVFDDFLVNEKDTYGRTFEGQPCEVRVVDYLSLGSGSAVLYRGPLGRIRYSDKSRAVFEAMPLINDQATVASEVYQQTCRWSLGDGNCKFHLDSFRVDFVVTEVINELAFRVNTLANQADNYFAWGQLEFTSGQNSGWAADVRGSNRTLKELRFWYSLPFAVAVGNTGHVWPGCDKLPTTCKTKFGNLLNFGGEWLAPQFTAI